MQTQNSFPSTLSDSSQLIHVRPRRRTRNGVGLSFLSKKGKKRKNKKIFPSWFTDFSPFLTHLAWKTLKIVRWHHFCSCSQLNNLNILSDSYGCRPNFRFVRPRTQILPTSLEWNLGGMKRWPHPTMQRAYHIELPTKKYQNKKSCVANTPVSGKVVFFFKVEFCIIYIVF